MDGSDAESASADAVPYVNPFWDTGPRALDALAASDPSMTREAQGGRRHGVTGDRAVQCDHAALS